MRAFFLALTTLLLLPVMALAQATDRPNTILVLDGSGSMWGQIDGVNKIVIARNVIADLLEDMADDVSLGLTVYGHRQRGSCGDIETLVEPAPFTQDRILEAVNAINPRGRTPMTDAVIAAAQALRHTEEAATVILVSDGIENCNPDPCAIATELEQAGVAFTVHVIGFDVASEPEARAQMQCIADNTGGQFLTADNAVELSAALEQVVVAAQPTPMRIEAQVLPQGTLPTRAVTWTLLGADGDIISQGVQAPAIDVQLFPGTYVAQAVRTEPDGPATYQTSFEVIEGQTDLVIVAMPPIVETSQVTFMARVEPDMSVPASPLNWTLQDAAGSTLLGPVLAPGGNVALLPGEYVLRVERVSRGTTHETRFVVEPDTPQEVVIPLPALLVDVSFVARIGDIGGLSVPDPIVWEVTPLDPAPEIATTNPATISLSRGAYRVTGYWTVQEIEATADFVVVDQPREIVVIFPEPQVSATLTSPATGIAGALTEVGWTGPGDDQDWIGFYDPANTSNHAFEAITRLRVVEGNPLSLRLPPEPGTYELRYIQEQDRAVLARLTVEVLPVPATVTLPSGIAGDVAPANWTGPAYPNDWIGFYPVDDTTSHSYDAVSRARVVAGENPIRDLRYPARPGTYELRYIASQDRTVIARQIVEVIPVQATLTVAPQGIAGDPTEIGWTGPDYPNDWIGFYDPADTTSHSYDAISRVSTADGVPARLSFPPTPGTYELRYVMGQDRVVIARATVEVTEVQATLTAPTTGVAGDPFELGWTGPANDGDWIGFYRVDDRSSHSYDAITRIAVDADRNPTTLRFPPRPGTYELRYVMAQGRTVIARQAIEVTPQQASLTVPEELNVNALVDIGWTGPAHEGDWIGIYRVDDRASHSYDAVSRVAFREDTPNPIQLRMPDRTGTFELRYVMELGRTVLARQTIEVSENEASITAPPTAVAGSMIEVSWVGPDERDDYIGIGQLDRNDNPTWDTWVATEEGNPLRIRVPSEPGQHFITYFLRDGRTPLVSTPLEVTDVDVTLTAPDEAAVGTTIDVGWTGPDYDDDYIGIGRLDRNGNPTWENWVYTAEGSIVRLLVPTEPGDYLITYFMRQDRRAITSVPITVTEQQASITAPESADAGSTIEVGWTGPDFADDYIGIGRLDRNGNPTWENWANTRDGNPARILVPAEAGDYFITYFLRQDRRPLVSVPITVNEQAATLTVPATAVAGSTIEVGWTGPDFHDDYIGIGQVGATGGNQWENYSYTRDGATLRLLVPMTPGDYLVTYFINQDRTAIAQEPITVTAAEASVTAPPTAVAGSTIEIAWTGPDYNDDFIGIGLVGASGGGRWDNYTYTRDGDTLRLLVPATPGTYEITYFANQDRTALARATLEATPIEASLTAPATASPGSVIEVGWTGPNYSDDYIGIGRFGATGGGQWEDYTYTRDGSPVQLEVPDEPGQYVIRYFVNQDRTVVAETEITVQ